MLGLNSNNQSHSETVLQIWAFLSNIFISNWFWWPLKNDVSSQSRVYRNKYICVKKGFFEICAT